jgi:hypothetical protein
MFLPPLFMPVYVVAFVPASDLTGPDYESLRNSAELYPLGLQLAETVWLLQSDLDSGELLRRFREHLSERDYLVVLTVKAGSHACAVRPDTAALLEKILAVA